MSLSPPMPPYNSADPQASFLSSSCLDFLLIELVPLAHRITTECDTPVALLANSSSAAAADSSSSAPPNAHSHQHQHHSYHPPPSSASVAAPESVAAASHHAGGGATGSVASMPRRLDEDEHLDAVHYRLESNGYRVGQGLVERFSKDRPRFNDTLDVIKFICKDLWYLVFGKHIDNLKTNHRGVYVLTDNAFRPFSRMSTETGSQAVIRAQPFLWFPCGVVRGALAALGINATVQAEVTELPGAVFQIKTIPAKP